MTLGAKGTLFVGTRDSGGGEVYAVLPGAAADGPHRVVTIARGLRSPNGVAFRDGALFVAEIGRVLRYDGIESRLSDPPAPVVVNDRYPKDAHHGWKFIRFGPDGLLYVPVGAPCNVCERDDPRYASITRIRPDGSGFEVFASGVRTRRRRSSGSRITGATGWATTCRPTN
jgi:glucose/arabinose dehydrogenase